MLRQTWAVPFVAAVLVAVPPQPANAQSGHGIEVGQQVRTTRPTAVRELPRRRAKLVIMLPPGVGLQVLQVGRWWANVGKGG